MKGDGFLIMYERAYAFAFFLLACIGTGKFSLFTLWELPALGEDGEMVWDISAAELGGYSDISFGSSVLSIYRIM